ncbi:hypothetical protein BDV95DRAFT_188033 [Massariosphaeria phaeospora]|uniref:Uncharacterized protein n=1 Tax=Massariosphaeria phaeospora TaxID=100035 RepID=A0A7C8I3S8_9PLEO|nr:hypothetical protein BDV95DRAFT_188033 [Massariosphaeria phaeospora]
MSRNTTKPSKATAPDKTPDTPYNGEKINTNKASQYAGFRHFVHFLQSYGLKISDHDDVEEGKAILRGMGYDV